MDALSFVKFSEVQNWSVSALTTKDLEYHRNIILYPIGAFISKSDDSIDIKDDEKYVQVTVHTNNGGMKPRDTSPISGKYIGTKRQYRIHEGQFLISRIDARNGAFGIVPSDLENAIVTHDFPAFNVDSSRLNPEYLLLITVSQRFRKIAQECSSGTTNRQRIDINKFISQRIPIPSKLRQDELVAEYNNTIAEAKSKEVQAAQIEDGLDNFLLDELGAYVTKYTSSSNLNFVHYKNMNRWDVSSFVSSIEIRSKYGTVCIGSCFDHFMEDMSGKRIRIETSKQPKADFHYLGMENIEKNTGELLEMPVVKGTDIKSQTLMVPQGFLIYGKLRPYLNKYWYNDTQYSDIVCSSEFFVFHVKQEINTQYVKYILASSFVQHQLSNLSSGARMPRIDEKIFKNIRVPIPPADVQNFIVVRITEMKAQIKTLKRQAADLRYKALRDFEKEIFE